MILLGQPGVGKTSLLARISRSMRHSLFNAHVGVIIADIINEDSYGDVLIIVSYER